MPGTACACGARRAPARLHEDAVGADAGLAGIAEGRGDDAGRRRVHIRVVEDDVGRVAALARAGTGLRTGRGVGELVVCPLRARCQSC